MEPNVAAVAGAQSDDAVFGLGNCELSGLTGPIHLMGIGGIGMSALARLLLDRGIAVKGSDKSESEITKQLTDLGAKIFVGHNISNIEGAAAVVVSTAITQDNPELAYAKANKIPVWHRSELLAALTVGKKVVAVSGTHGKTTTTGMIGQMLTDGKLDPSIVVGGIFTKIKANARAGKGSLFVTEADESDGTHVRLKSEIAVITNIESDHLENYPGGIEEIYKAMIAFGNNAKKAVVLCYDDAGCRQIIPKLRSKVITYGAAVPTDKTDGADYQYESLPGFAFRVLKNGETLGEMVTSVPGEHNKLNALAAVAVGLELGLTFSQIADSLADFRGVDRRFQLIGTAKNVLIVDDYAHHPTEVVATLLAARQYIEANPKGGFKRVVAVFQPHQPGRLKDFWNEFCQCFAHADLVLIADVYIARGTAIPGVDSETLVKEIAHKNVKHLAGKTETLAQQIAPILEPGDLVLTIGAGDITGVGPQLLEILQTK